MIIALIILAVLAIVLIGVYNSLVRLKNKCEEAWADIDTQLKRRYDLIPNIVETVKGYASHEAQTLENVVAARSQAMNAQGVQDQQAAENMLTGALKSLFALAENYPELKANQNFLDLQQTLKEVEEHLQMARRYYNGTVRDFNTKIELFPNNLVAGMLGFKQREFFQAQEDEKENVKVDFSNKEQTAPASPAAAPTPAPAATQEAAAAPQAKPEAAAQPAAATQEPKVASTPQTTPGAQTQAPETTQEQTPEEKNKPEQQ